ncbi:MAG: YitT family protein [Candidatus Onthomonas sp.]
MRSDLRFIRRLLMTLFGVFVAAIAVGLFKASVMGVDPFQAFSMGLWGRFGGPLSYGTFYAVLNLIILVVDFFLDRHYIGIATLINLFLTGYVVSFSENCIHAVLPEPVLWQRIVLLAVGVVVLCFASAFYITADLGVSTYDALALILTGKKAAPFSVCRIGCDLICVIVGFACGAVIGVGTLITAFFMGPLISFFRTHVSDPLLNARLGAEQL